MLKVQRLHWLIPLLITLSNVAACDGQPSPQSAVLIVLDTLRADRLGVYGHSRPTSPHIDQLAREGIVFENAISYAAWTLPSMTALLSGRYPTRQEFDGGLKRSLVENLSNSGIRTAAFTEGGYVSHHFGIDRGFEVYHDPDSAIRVAGEANAPEVAIGRTFSAAGDWLRQNADHPFFLFIHTYEIHIPYLRSSFARELPRGELHAVINIRENQRIRSGEVALRSTEQRYLAALYDSGIRVADREVGKFVSLLDELGISDQTVVVVTSDHGEDLGDRYPRYAAEHGHSLYDELVRVPLVIRGPQRGESPRRVAQTVRSVDIMPTILDWLGVDHPTGEGRSLLPLVRGQEVGDRAALSHNLRFGPERLALRIGEFKLIRNLSPDPSKPPVDENAAAVEFYDLSRDPGERSNIASERLTEVDRLQSELDASLERTRKLGLANFGPRPELAPELERQLEALGYVR